MAKADADSTAEKFNRIFELEVGWTNDADGDRVKFKDIEEFTQLCNEIADKLRDRELQQAIWTLTQNKWLIRIALSHPDLMLSLKLTNQERDSIKEIIRQPYRMYSVERFKDDAFKKSVRVEESGIKTMQLFYRDEEIVLRRAGLNQASIAIIIQRIKQSQQIIWQHILSQESVLTGKYRRSVDALQTFARTVGGSIKELSSDSAARIRVPRATLARSKDKIIGLATLWGDAVPLVLSKDWGIASVISATAGATVASILPSGKQKPEGRQSQRKRNSSK